MMSLEHIVKKSNHSDHSWRHHNTLKKKNQLIISVHFENRLVTPLIVSDASVFMVVFEEKPEAVIVGSADICES